MHFGEKYSTHANFEIDLQKKKKKAQQTKETKLANTKMSK